MDIFEVLGAILVPILLFILNGIKKDIRDLRRRVDDVSNDKKNCDCD